MLPLLLLLSGTALAGVEIPVQICTARVVPEGGSGDEGSAPGWSALVQGHGRTEAEARTRLRLAGRHLAARAFAGERGAELLFTEFGAGPEGLDGTSAGPVLGLPGVRLVEVACSEISVPGAEGARAEVLGTAVSRADPAVAASTARRLACERAWVGPFARAFSRSATMSSADRVAALEGGVEEAREALFDCHAAPASFTAAQVPPQTHPAGTVSCVAHGLDPEVDLGGHGLASDLEAAVDAAGWERATQIALGPLGAALRAQSHTAADLRMLEVARALAQGTEIMDSESLETALTACTLHPASDLRLAWAELPNPNLDACAADWPPAPLAVGTEGAAGAKARACKAVMDANLDQVHPAVRKVSPEMRPTLRAAAWGITLSCEARCGARLRPAGAGEVLPTPGPLARDPADGARRFAEAVAARDLEAVFAVAPGLGAPNQRAPFQDQPDRAWAGLAELATMLEGGQTPRGLRWLPVGDHVILVVGAPPEVGP